jgi:tetratricopeptide (TPR) repeat protein
MGPAADEARRVRASELHRRAISADASIKPQDSLNLLRRAFRLLEVSESDDDMLGLDADSRALVIRLLTTMAKVESDLRGLAHGLDRLQQAQRLASRHGDRVLSAIVGLQNAYLLGRFGESERALVEYLAVEPDLKVLPVENRCNLLLDRGVVRLSLMQLPAARADFARCVTQARAAGLNVHVGMALHNLGYVDFLSGDLVRALDEMNAAIHDYEGLPVAISALDRARVLNEAGLTREADLAFGEAEATLRRDRSSVDLAEVELERARCALISGDVVGARRLAARSRDRYRRVGGVAGRRQAELVLLQADLAAGRPGGRLLPPALRLRDEFGGAGLRLSALSATLIAAEAALRAGDLAVAESLLAGVGKVSADSPLTLRLHLRRVRAQAERACGRNAAAARLIRTGIAELDAHRARFGSIDLQTAAGVHGRRLAELDLAIALETGRASAVLAAAERGRASSSRLQLVRPPADAEMAQLLAELRQVHESLRGAGSDIAAIGTLHSRRRALEREIGARGWTREGSGAVERVADHAAVRDALGERSMITFVQAEDELHAVVVDSGLRLVHLGRAAVITEQVRRLRADLDVLAQAFLAPALRAAVTSSALRAAAELDAALIRPLVLPERPLVISTTGVLGQLPWSMLPSLQSVPVVVVPSATAWLTADRTRRRRSRTITALAGPDVAQGAREVGGVAAAWPEVTLVVGKDAEARTFRRALSRSAVLHVAAHGVHNTENPLFSSLRLADGVFFAHELDMAGRVPEHVVLSTCELGLADVRPGDEGLGLTSVLLRLGTRSVVASVARVSDEVAADVMIDYHRRLVGGADSAAALAEALAKAEGFAPFVCFGSAWTAGRA